MLNNAQIKKLQNKVGKKVDIEIKKREAVEKVEMEKKFQHNLTNLIEMRREIQELKKVYGDCGPYFVLWKQHWYILNHDNKVVEFDFPIEEIQYLDKPCKVTADKVYYFYKNDVYANQQKLYKFISDHYVTMRLAVVGVHKADKDSIVNMLQLNDVFKKFAAEFPNGTMADLIALYQTFDKYAMNFLSSTE